jgi:hypothetical protein
MKDQFRNTLVKKFFIRMHMTVILMCTLFVGLIFSKFAYYLGWTDLTSRYLVGFILSYVSFLGFIRIWLWYVFRTAPQNDTEMSDLDFLDFWVYSSGRSSSTPAYKGEGGGFSGGGANGSWGESKSSESILKDVSLGDIGDADEAAPFLLVLALIIFLLGLIFGGFYIIIEAPVFLGDIAFELALSLGIIKIKGRKEHPVSWLEKAFSKTIIPVIVVSIVIIIIGSVINSYNPEITKSSELISWIAGSKEQ